MDEATANGAVGDIDSKSVNGENVLPVPILTATLKAPISCQWFTVSNQRPTYKMFTEKHAPFQWGAYGIKYTRIQQFTRFVILLGIEK